MLAALLYQRGLFVLHASVIQVADRAVASWDRLGGKVNAGSRVHAHGYSVVADDNAAVELRGGSLLVLPAFPSLKVYPDIAGTLGYDAASLRLCTTPRREVPTRHGICRESGALGSYLCP